MTDTISNELAEKSDRAVLLHDLRHALYAIQLVPLLLEKHRKDSIRFHEICEGLSRECEFISARIEAEFADEAELSDADNNGEGEPPAATEWKGDSRDGDT